MLGATVAATRARSPPAIVHPRRGDRAASVRLPTVGVRIATPAGRPFFARSNYARTVPETVEPVQPPGAADRGTNAGRTAGGARSGRTPSGPIAVGAVLFVIGLLAIGVIMVLFATGAHDLPLWLNLTAMLAPVGFGIGLIGIFAEARSGQAARAERARSRRAGVEPQQRAPIQATEPETGQSV